jgi:hypothetical protein
MALAMAERRCTVLCDRETAQGPPTVLLNREAARVPCASSPQARGRGRPRHPGVTLAACLGARAGVQATAEGSGGTADALWGVHGRRETRLAERAPQAHPVCVP